MELPDADWLDLSAPHTAVLYNIYMCIIIASGITVTSPWGCSCAVTYSNISTVALCLHTLRCCGLN